MRDPIEEAFVAAEKTQPSMAEKGATLRTNAHHPHSNRRNRWTLAIYLLAFFYMSELPEEVKMIACHSWCAWSCWNAQKHAHQHLVTSYAGLLDVLQQKGFSESNNNTTWDALVNALSDASNTSWTDPLLLEKWQLLVISCLAFAYISWFLARSVFPVVRSGGGLLASICMGCPCIEAPVGKALRWVCNRHWALFVLGVASSAFASQGVKTITTTLKSPGRQRWGCDWPGTGWFIFDEALWIISWSAFILLGQRIVKTIRLSEEFDECKDWSCALGNGLQIEGRALVDTTAPIQND